MLKYVQTILSALLISTTVFLVACSGSEYKSGDRFEGTGTATISQSGDIKGDGKGKSHTADDGDVEGHKGNDGKDGDGGDDDDDNNKSYKLKDPTDKIVCTSSTGVVTVYGKGDTINKTAKATCVVTPASQVSGTTSSGSGSSGSSSSSSGSTTSTTGTSSTGSGSSTSTAKNPANSF